MSNKSTAERAAEQIAKQATTGTAISPGPEGWVDALPQLDGVACEFHMEDKLTESYVWYEDGAYRASELGSGLEDREGRPLNRIEALALLDGGLLYRPTDLSEVQ